MTQTIQRLISLFFYSLPLKASFPFGYFLFLKFSFLKILFYFTIPITIIERFLPFGSFLLFLILFAGVVRNPNVPYFVRYNACQSLLLNIGLIIIGIIIGFLTRIFPLIEFGSIVFVFTLSIIIFSTFKCIYGVEPEIPFISKSVRMSI